MSIFKNEQENKFIQTYRLYVDEIYQYVYLRTGMNKALAEDITQEIFVDVFKGMSSFKGLSSERTWIYKITKNRLNDFYRKQYRSKFEMEKVQHCLDDLLEQYKIVLVLKYIDEKSVKDIASILGKSPKAIESILQRAKNAFVKSYTQYEEKEDL